MQDEPWSIESDREREFKRLDAGELKGILGKTFILRDLKGEDLQ